jgi:TPR repeat protein
MDRAELIEWQDALEKLSLGGDVFEGMRLVRSCRHPDAQWLASLLVAQDVEQVPDGENADLKERRRICEVLRKVEDDPRAMYFAFVFSGYALAEDFELRDRAAARGYAPAQASMACAFINDDDAQHVFWAQLAAAQQDRDALYMFGMCCRCGRGCERDVGKAIELFRSSAELEFPEAQYALGELAYGALDWQRYHWMGRAAQKGRSTTCGAYCNAVLGLLPSFERGENARILHTVAQAIRPNLNFARGILFRRPLDQAEVAGLKQVVDLGEAMKGRVRRAIACWAVAGRRLGLVKDMRVIIS